ncbi:MAG: hypothetical protein Q8873_00385 [Bacillota bacterium]|nr:hypothetical protein [Bacillota bacterium]
MTNFERIKAMSVEEMAKFMLFFIPRFSDANYTGICGKYYKKSCSAIIGNKKWLESEATDG